MQLGVRCPRGQIDWNECLGSCVHDPLHPCEYTADVLNMMRVDYEDPDREPGVESFTPTRILGCARQPVLMRDADYYVDVEQAYPATRGNMVHALMEKPGEPPPWTNDYEMVEAKRVMAWLQNGARYPGALKVIREKRLRVEIETKYGPQLFTAKPDLVVVKDILTETDTGVYREGSSGKITVKVVDYKSKKDADIAPRMTSSQLDHQLQVNMYAWMVTQTLAADLGVPDYQVEVDELEIVYCSMQKIRRFTSAGPRQVKGKRVSTNPPTYEQITLEPIALWKPSKVGKYIRSKIEEMMDAREDKLPDILEGDAAWRCRYCPVYDLCHKVGNTHE